MGRHDEDWTFKAWGPDRTLLPRGSDGTMLTYWTATVTSENGASIEAACERGVNLDLEYGWFRQSDGADLPHAAEVALTQAARIRLFGMASAG